MYQIYVAALDEALTPEVKTRPVVVVEEYKHKVRIMKVTSRLHENDIRYVHLNNYKVHGYVNVSEPHVIDKKYLKSFIRDCTASEQEEIEMGELGYIHDTMDVDSFSNVILYSSLKWKNLQYVYSILLDKLFKL